MAMGSLGALGNFCECVVVTMTYNYVPCLLVLRLTRIPGTFLPQGVDARERSVVPKGQRETPVVFSLGSSILRQT